MVKVKKVQSPKNKSPRILRGRVVKRSNRSSSDKENDAKECQVTLTPTKKSVTASPPKSPCFKRSDFTGLSEVGRGGFSVVYRAFMPSKNSNCILKYFNFQQIERLNFGRGDIDLEKSLHKTLNHINIPRLFGFFETPMNAVLVMEYCDAGDLYDYIHRKHNMEKQRFPKTHERNQCYLRQLVTAVEYFQATTKYIHMDIKPENILVTSNDMIKLSDFGCCVKMQSPRFVHTKSNGGTKTYRPPEMLRKPSQFDSTADVWSIGCVAFEMWSWDETHPFFFDSHMSSPSLVNISKALGRISDFKKGICLIGGYNKMDGNLKTFLRHTLGTDREDRPLVSKLLETGLLTHTARNFNPR